MVLHFTLAFAFGILGNVVSFGVSLSPLPTFYQIYKKKTSKGFQSLPYVVSLFSAMLWIYYALLKKHQMLLITINTFVLFIQSFYILTHFFYSPKNERIVTGKLFFLFIVFGFGAVYLSTMFLKEKRLPVLGYICMGFSLGVFAAPLGIVRKVIKTKSAEFMPFYLSLTLTLGAVMWFGYGFLLKDMNIAVPNVLGFFFGILQMILYTIYRKGNQGEGEGNKGEGEAPKKVIKKNDAGSDEFSFTIHIVRLHPHWADQLSTVAPPPPIAAVKIQKKGEKINISPNMEGSTQVIRVSS